MERPHQDMENGVSGPLNFLSISRWGNANCVLVIKGLVIPQQGRLKRTQITISGLALETQNYSWFLYIVLVLIFLLKLKLLM